MSRLRQAIRCLRLDSGQVAHYVGPLPKEIHQRLPTRFGVESAGRPRRHETQHRLIARAGCSARRHVKHDRHIAPVTEGRNRLQCSARQAAVARAQALLYEFLQCRDKT